MTEKWTGGIYVTLANGRRWSGQWDFTSKIGCSKPSRVLRAARRALAEEKVVGRSRWVSYSIDVELPK